MLTLQTLTWDLIPGRLRAGQEKLWHLRPIGCSAHNISWSEYVYNINVPARSPDTLSVYKIWEVNRTRDCEWEKKMEQNSLDGSAFAKVILQGQYDGAAALLMLFWTRLDIPFLNELGLMNHGTEKLYLLVEKSTSGLNELNQSYQFQTGPTF